MHYIKIKNILIVALLIMIAAIPLSAEAKADEFFTIDKYYVNVEVLENNTMEIEEILFVNFNALRHGIYREIPRSGYMTRTVDGVEMKTKYSAVISDVYVDGFNYEVYNEGINKVIKIGEEDKLVSGVQKYRILYTIDFGDDGITDFDELNLNIIGNYWDTIINEAYMTVKLPKEFDPAKFGVSSGYEGMEGSNIIDYKVLDNNFITMRTTGTLHPFEGVNIRIELPEGYFIGERVPYDWSNVYYIATGVLFLMIFSLWLAFGRDEKIYPSAEFYPPEGLTPAEIGYAVDGTVDSKDVLSLLIYWADKGYIKIEERTKRDFYLIQLRQLPPEAEYYEHVMFGELFRNRAVMRISDLLGVFTGKNKIKDFEEALDNQAANNELLSYVRVKDLESVFYTTINSVKAMIKDKYKDKTGSRIFTRKSIFAKVVTFLLLALPIFFGVILIKGRSVADTGSLSAGAMFLTIAVIIVFVVLDAIVRNWHSTKKGVRALKVMIIVFILLCLYIGSMAAIVSSPDDVPSGFLAVSASFIMGILGLFMHKRTPEMNKLQEKILGLKMFLNNAEKDRINTLVNENPEYFYNILPYAYVLGVTDKWAKKFEHLSLQPPSWYSGYVPIAHFSASAFESSLTRGFGTMSSTMSSSPSSSGGGGGSSGGGGGGGGGGSW